MPLVLVNPANDLATDMTNAVVIDVPDLPASDLDAEALGLSLDVNYRFQLLGDAVTGTVTDEVAPPISITNNPDNTITIDGDGAAQITLTEPTEYAGTYTLSATQVANLATTPVNLVAPTMTGENPGEVGDTYALEYPGLWAFDGVEPTATYQWQRGGVDIAGQTDETGFTATVAGAVRLVETYGNASQASATATVGAASGFAVSGVDDWSVDVNTQNHTRAIADLTSGTDFVLYLSSISSSDYFTSATLAGVPGVLIAEASQDNSEYSQAWAFSGVSATSGNLVLTGGTSAFRRMSLQLVAAANFQILAPVPLNTGSDATATITADVLVGDVALVTFGKGLNGNDALFDPVVGFTPTQNVNQSARPTIVGAFEATANEAARVFSVTGDAGQRNVGFVLILRAE